MSNDYHELPASEEERVERREKKRRPKMAISGRSVLDLVRILREKAKGEKPLIGKSGRRKRR
jgi:uroporphyrinogen-III decarboxylase